MNPEEIALTGRAALLRQAFDQAFAAAPVNAAASTEAYLAIAVGGDNYALRLTEVSGLFVDKQVVPLPTRAPDLLGIASFRGVLVPVYDLRTLLGYSGGQPPRWLVLIAPEAPVGLAFDHLDGYLDIAPEAIAGEQETEHARPYLAETLRTESVVRPVVDTASILETIKQRVLSSVTHRER